MGYAKNRAMELDARGFGEVDGAVCLDHLTDPSLAGRLAPSVSERECTVCGRGCSEAGEPFAVPIELVTTEIVGVLHDFYTNADSVLPWDSEDRVLLGPQCDVWEAVADVSTGAFDSQSHETLVDLIVDAIGDDVMLTPWSSPADQDMDELDYAWIQFANVARFQTRIVIGLGSSDDPPGRLAHYLNSVLVYASAELNLVRSLPSGTPLYRGRLCEEPKSIRRNARDLGPAPRGKATANRMSPAGVPYFYASGDADTAVAEIAGHGVEPFAVVGKFTTTRDLRILDLTGEPDHISPFDLERREHARMARFLTAFVHNVTAPVIPDGRQHVEYAPTQILTEFLRWVPEPRLDGIALPSSQNNAKTYVLFFDSEDCWTEGTAEPVRSTDLFAFGVTVDDEPALQLNPEDVVTYRVNRKYSAVDAGPAYRGAPPWDESDG